LLTATPAAPSAGDPGWKTSPPAQYTFAADGLQILYAWAKDAVGIISEMATAVVDISIFVNRPPVADAGFDQMVTERTKNKNGKRARTLEAKAIKMKRLSIESARKAEESKEKYEALKDCIENNGNGEDDSHDDEASDDDNDEDED
jgi:hypothetical protein